jgi:phage terminase large subunit-like protein
VAKKVIKVNKMSKSKPKAPTQLEQIKKDPVLRREAARRSHLFFFHAFLSHHAKYNTAPFQKELLALSQDQCKKFLIVEAFRGSAKSTIMALSLPIWSIIGIHEKKFVLIICKTQQQARQTMKNITEELTSNEFLKNELGPFDEPDDEWRQTSIVIPKYDARVTVVSLDTSVRGIKHGAHRPDLIIADDLEDLASVKSQEGRQKLYDQIFGDIVPMGDIATRVVVIGTRLHDDGIIMRMRQDIEAEKLDGVFRSFPLVDESDKIAWPQKFPNMEAIESLRKTVPSIQAWSREYLLRIIDDEETVVRRTWIQRYVTMPPIEGNPDYQFTLTGVDLAISESTRADYTAMVSLSAFRDRDSNWSAYVHEYLVNERLDFPAARDRIKELSRVLGKGYPTPIHIESVGYQGSMAQDLRHDGFPAEEFKVHGQDKRMRLSLVTHLIKDGIVKFPEHNANILIGQLVGFGTERHDDLVDAFAIALHILMDKMTAPGFTIPSSSPPSSGRDENAHRENDLWKEDRRLAWVQGRMTPEQWYESQEKWRQRKIEVDTQIAQEQQRKNAEDEERRWKQYNLQVYKDLMRRR